VDFPGEGGGADALLKRLAADFKKTAEQSEKRIVGRLNTIEEKIEGVKTELKEVDGKVQNHEGRITDLEKKRAGSAGGPQGGGDGTFVPQHLEVKGFCTCEERQTKGVSRTVIDEFVKKFRESMDEEKRSWVGASVVRSLKSYKFKVKVNSEYIWEVKEMWSNFVESNDEKLSGSTPYFIVERSPEAQKIFNKMGATFANLQKKVKLPKIISADWRAKEFYIKKTKEDAEEKPLISIREDLSIKWWEEGVAISGFSEAELVAALR
jgi:hypothetical protein